MSNEPTRVLIAEDEALIRLDLKEMLEEEGYVVVGEVGDGQAAVEELATVKRAANKAVLAKNERIAALETELATVAAVAFKRSCAACESRRTQAAALTDEIARLQGIVGQLRSEAGDRESKLARVQKTNASLRDDKDGLNMALEVRSSIRLFR